MLQYACKVCMLQVYLLPSCEGLCDAMPVVRRTVRDASTSCGSLRSGAAQPRKNLQVFRTGTQGCVHRTKQGAHTDTELGRRRDIMSNLKAETLARWSLEGKTAVVTGGTKVGLWYTRLRQWFNSWCGRGRRPPYYCCYPNLAHPHEVVVDHGTDAGKRHGLRQLACILSCIFMVGPCTAVDAAGRGGLPACNRKCKHQHAYLCSSSPRSLQS